jgi:hypothetical protein
MTTAKKKTVNGKGTLTGGLNLINNLWQNVEGELDKAFKTARHQGKKSTATLLKTVDDLVNNINATEIRRRAAATGSELKREFKKISNGVMSQIKTVETALEDGALNDVVDKIKNNLSATVDKISDMEVLEYAKVRMQDTREQVFSALQIPSHDDVAALTRKLATLEKKLNALKRHDVRQ